MVTGAKEKEHTGEALRDSAAARAATRMDLMAMVDIDCKVSNNERDSCTLHNKFQDIKRKRFHASGTHVRVSLMTSS